MRNRNSSFLRSFVFGVEDSLVSTIGLVAGITVSGLAHSRIILVSIILVCVEAFSMAVGSLLSEHSAEEFETRKVRPIAGSSGAALIMFVSYFISGAIILVPFFFLDSFSALNTSIIIALLMLYLLGSFSARISNIKPFFRGMTTLLIGGGAVLIGLIVGIVGSFAGL